MEKKLFNIFGGDDYCSLVIRVVCVTSFTLVMSCLLVLLCIVTYGIALVPISMFTLMMLEVNKPNWYRNLKRKCKKPEHLR